MVNLLDVVLALVILVVLAVSLLNPEGFIVAVFIVAVIIAIRLAVPFFRELIVSRHSGSKGRIKAQKAASRAEDRSGRD